MAEFKLGRLRFVWQGQWTTAHAYVKDDVVRYGGKSYTCMIGHTSDATDFYEDLNDQAVKWSLMTDGVEWKGVWLISTYYKIGDLVKVAADTYICTEGHTSAATSLGFYVDNAANKWDLMTTGIEWTGTWEISTFYNIGDIINFGAHTYVCINGHTSSGTSNSGFYTDLLANWELLNKGQEWKGSWTTATYYKIGDIVSDGGNSYITLIGHTSTTTADAISAGMLALFSGGLRYRGIWDINTPYLKDDVVRSGSSAYIAIAVVSGGLSPALNPSFTLLAAGAEGFVAKIGDIMTGNLVIENPFGVYVGTTAQNLLIDSAGYVGLTNVVSLLTKNANDFVQFAVKNTNSGASASTDLIAYASGGDNDSGWIDLGITSSTYSDPEFTVTGPGTGYLFMSAPAGTLGTGDLLIGTDSTGTHNDVVLFTNGFTAGNERMRIVGTDIPGTPAGVHLLGTGGILYAGPGAAGLVNDALNYVGLTNAAAVFSKDANDFVQFALKNTNSGDSASTDLIAYASDGDNDSGWIDLGITSKNYSDPEFTVTGPGTGYLFMSAPAGTLGTGDLLIGTDSTGSHNDIAFFTDGFLAGNERMRIIGNDRPGTPAGVEIYISTSSTSISTGALRVRGGMGLLGNLYVGGNVDIQGTISIGGSGSSLATTTLAVSDPTIRMGTGNPTDVVDLGFVAEHGVSTTLNGNVTINATTITVVSTASFPSTGVLSLTTDSEKIAYTGKTATTFTGCTRGFSGTAASTHTSGTNIRFTLYTGLVRDASDGIFKLFDSSQVIGSTVVDFSGDGLVYAPLKVSAITATTGTSINKFSVDGTLINNLDTSVPTEKAVKTYVDTQVVKDTIYPIKLLTTTGNVLVREDEVQYVKTNTIINSIVEIVGTVMVVDTPLTEPLLFLPNVEQATTTLTGSFLADTQYRIPSWVTVTVGTSTTVTVVDVPRTYIF